MSRVIFPLVLIAIVAGVLWAMVISPTQRSAECEAKGGVWFIAQWHYICLRKDAVIEIN